MNSEGKKRCADCVHFLDYYTRCKARRDAVGTPERVMPGDADKCGLFESEEKNRFDAWLERHEEGLRDGKSKR